MNDPSSAAPIARSSLGAVLLMVADEQGRILHFDTGCERASGRDAASVLGRPLDAHLLGAVSATPLEQQLRDVREGAPPAARVGTWCAPGGEPRCIFWQTAAVEAPGAAPLLVCTGVDITDLQRNDAALHEGAARLHAVLEAAVDGIITIDEAACIESINPAVEQLFGWSAAELVGEPVSKLMPEPYRSYHDAYMRHYRETGERRIIGIGREVEGRRKDGSVFPMELAVSEVELPGRRLFTGIVRDVSKRRQAEQEARHRLEELAHASRLADLGELTSSIAHEINQPLTAIVSFADACLRMLRSGSGSPELLRGALEQISAQGERAGNIVHNLRQFVRKGGSTRTQVDVNAVIREVLDLLSHDIRQRAVTIDLALDRNLPVVPADRVQVSQVALNLVRNALDALPAEKDARREIRISTARTGGKLIEVAVTDTGTGLPPDGPQRVFETFFTTKPDGMGIGLSICRSLVEAHGGRLTAESNEREGATFRFTLPMSAAGHDGA